MTVKQGQYARAAAFAIAAVLVVVAVEAFGRAVLALVLGPDGDVAGAWTGVRMAGYSVVFVLAMLAIGRVGAALTYQGPDPSEPDIAEPDSSEPDSSEPDSSEPDIAGREP